MRYVLHLPLPLFFIVASGPHTSGQDLVPNGSFEEVLACPDWPSQLDRTAHWFDPSELGTPDYFHTCGSSTHGVPDNAIGHQAPVDGLAYTGIFLHVNGALSVDVREYLEVELLATLVAGECYHFRMYANLGDISGLTTDALGVHFSPTPIFTDDAFPPPLIPQLTLAPGVMLNKDDWTLFEGDLIAAGGEGFLMIGNFLYDAQTTFVPVEGGAADLTYCLVDQVSLTPCMPTAIHHHEQVDRIGPVSIASNGFMRIPGMNKGSYRIYSSTGQLIQDGMVADGLIVLTRLSKGAYVIELDPGGVIIHQRFILP